MHRAIRSKNIRVRWSVPRGQWPVGKDKIFHLLRKKQNYWTLENTNKYANVHPEEWKLKIFACTGFCRDCQNHLFDVRSVSWMHHYEPKNCHYIDTRIFPVEGEILQTRYSYRLYIHHEKSRWKGKKVYLYWTLKALCSFLLNGAFNIHVLRGKISIVLKIMYISQIGNQFIIISKSI